MPVDVSVIIPAWNAGRFVGRAIESALSQAGVSLEVLVVDDASDDDTAEQAARCGDPRVRIHRLTKNLGPSGARNAAIERAQGRWLAILDADDALLPGRLARLAALGDAHKAGVVADNLLFDLGREQPRQPIFAPRGVEPSQYTLSASEFIRSNCLMAERYNYGFLKPLFARDCVHHNRIRYDEAVLLGEDYLFVLEVMLCGGRFVFDERPGYLYRIHETSLSSQRLDRTRIRGILEGDARLLQRYDLQGELAKAQAQRHRSLLDADAYVAMADSLKAQAFGEFFKQALRRPTALRHFRHPLQTRMQGVFGALRTADPGGQASSST